MSDHSLNSRLRVALIQFPGSNCDFDCIEAFKRLYGVSLQLVWHTETELPPTDRVILPGGFSYGDYLRGGALAAHSPVMVAVRRFAQSGGAVLGICNGFQILTEAGLLPGILLKNRDRKFICRQTELEVVSGPLPYQVGLRGTSHLQIPVAHGEGRYYISAQGLSELQANNQILLRYRDDFNGATDRIAGITSRDGRILGLMPHPERAVESLLGGSEDGVRLLDIFMSL